MKAYKIWYDTKHYVHKDTTESLNLTWTENIEEAKDFKTLSEAYDFCFVKLGLKYAGSNALQLA